MVELGAPHGIVSAAAAFKVDNEPKPALNAGLLSLLVEESIEGLYRCEARFGNWRGDANGADYRYFDRSIFDFGKPLVVTMGSGEAEAEVFRGTISAIEGQFVSGQSRQIVILAEDAANDLRVTRRTRIFEEMTDAEIFEQIANDHDLQPDIDIQGPTHQIVAQVNQSDLAFMRERAQRLAAEIWIQEGSLYVRSRTDRHQNGQELSLRFERGLLAFSVTADTANQYTKVVVSGWDVQAKDSLSHEATDSLLQSELNGDTSGASIVNAAFGERIDRIVRQTPLTADETQSLAEAAFRTQARRFVVGAGVARGDARIRVGRAIRLLELGPLFSGVYHITEARHIFSHPPDGGYTTEFVAERAGIGS